MQDLKSLRDETLHFLQVGDLKRWFCRLACLLESEEDSQSIFWRPDDARVAAISVTRPLGQRVRMDFGQ